MGKSALKYLKGLNSQDALFKNKGTVLELKMSCQIFKKHYSFA